MYKTNLGRERTCIHMLGTDSLEQLAARFGTLPKELEVASARVINRALSAVKTLGVKIASETYTSPVKDLRRDVVMQKATVKSQEGKVRFSGFKGVPLHLFQPIPRKKPNWNGVPANKRSPKLGVSTKIKRKGIRKVQLGEGGQKPFFATTRSGEVKLYYRKDEGRLPLVAAYGPSPIQLLMSDQAQEALYKKAHEVYRKRFPHEIERILGVTL